MISSWDIFPWKIVQWLLTEVLHLIWRNFMKEINAGLIVPNFYWIIFADEAP